MFSGYLFLWFGLTLAEELDSGQCTHCSGKHCFPRVPKVSIKLQTSAGLRCSARVAGKDVNKAVNKACFPGKLRKVKDSFPEYLRDS